jgi:hypothetical protein
LISSTRPAYRAGRRRPGGRGSQEGTECSRTACPGPVGSVGSGSRRGALAGIAPCADPGALRRPDSADARGGRNPQRRRGPPW